MFVVVDTNVLLSGLLRGRGTKPVLLALIARKFQLVTSEILLQELTEVLTRPAWREVFGSSETHELLAIIREAATFVRPTQKITVCRDAEDNVLLECAVSGRADFLVTGDGDLLVLGQYRGVRIVRPSEFLRLLP